MCSFQSASIEKSMMKNFFKTTACAISLRFDQNTLSCSSLFSDICLQNCVLDYMYVGLLHDGTVLKDVI